MICPTCSSSNTREVPRTTSLGYRQFHCRSCIRQFNERSGTSLNFIEYPTEVVMLAVYQYYRFKLSLDDVVELMATRGIQLCHQTVHNWTQCFGTELGIKLRKSRQGKAGPKWHIDATYIKIDGRWCYLYRAIDKQGNLVDVYLSDIRDQAAAEAFFRQCHSTTDVVLSQITTDKEPALYPAIKGVFGSGTNHRDVKYLNNCLEQDHRAIKSRYKVMKGFKDVFCALIFCTVFEELRQHFRVKNKSRSERRRINPFRFREYEKLWSYSL